MCPSLKSNVEVRVKREVQDVAALFTGQIHSFTYSLNYLLTPTVFLARSAEAEGKAGSFLLTRTAGPREDGRPS